MAATTFQEIGESAVYRSPDGVDEVAINPRCVAFSATDVVCSFMLQSGFGVNDFKAALCFSSDAGKTWSAPQILWPHLTDKLSCIGQISAISGTDSLLFFGVAFSIDAPGEMYWRDDIKGMKQNRLVWARSDDRGAHWSDPRFVELPHEGSAEAQGPILVTQQGEWIACYAPYRNWNANGVFELNRLMQLKSRDCGETWQFSKIMSFAEPESGAAESWLAELEDNVLLATCWHTNLAHDAASDFSNKYAVSRDGGASWNGPLDTGVFGQSTALLRLDARHAAFLYNQRKHGPVGIRLAIFEKTGSEVKIVSDELLWAAGQGTRGDSSGNHADWTDFAFGEPCLCRLGAGRFLLVFWEKGGPGRNGISTRTFSSESF